MPSPASRTTQEWIEAILDSTPPDFREGYEKMKSDPRLADLRDISLGFGREGVWQMHRDRNGDPIDLADPWPMRPHLRTPWTQR